MTDIFQNFASSLESPAIRLAAVTPNDNADLPVMTRAIAVGSEGFVKVTTMMGDIGRIYVVPGAPFPIRAARIWASDTTASDIVGLA